MFKFKLFFAIILINQFIVAQMVDLSTIMNANSSMSLSNNSISPNSNQVKYGVSFPSTDINQPLRHDNTRDFSIQEFDISINEDKYILGTGDAFLIYVWGSIEQQLMSKVDYSGNVFLPSIGLLSVKGLSLKEGKDKIHQRLKDVYKNAGISIVLNEIRKFKVYILGEVEKPGHYVVTGATRLSDLIQSAGGFKEEEKKSFDDYRHYRNIEIKNETLGDKSADLASFFHGNVIDENFYLREGDRIFIHKAKEYVSIYGAVNYPGSYGYGNENLLWEFIHNVAGGFSRGADSLKIFINRFYSDKDSLIEFSINEINKDDFKLLPDDRIFVKSLIDYRVHRKVRINGEVKYPGVYPIIEDRTRLTDIIKKAGGLTKDSFLNGSRIVRKKFNSYDDREFERLKNQPLESMSPIERSYLKTKLVEEDGIVSMDFSKLMEEGEDLFDIILRDNDIITIARKSLSVKVSGAVIAPGLISYKENESIGYYVKQAGGYNTKAKKRDLKVIKGGTDTWLKPNKVEKIEAGDIIWIPEKEYRNTLKITKELLFIIGSISATVLSGFAIKDAVGK